MTKQTNMSQIRLTHIPPKWRYFSVEERDEAAMASIRRHVRGFLVDHRHYYPCTAIGYIQPTGFFSIRLPGPDHLVMAIGCYRNEDGSYSTIHFILQNKDNVRCPNIGYKNGPIGSKTCHTYEDLLAEVMTVYSWAQQGHIDITP